MSSSLSPESTRLGAELLRFGDAPLTPSYDTCALGRAPEPIALTPPVHELDKLLASPHTVAPSYGEKHSLAIERAIDAKTPRPEEIRSGTARPGDVYGLTAGLDGKLTRLNLPDLRLIRLEGCGGWAPVAVYCPCCAKARGYDPQTQRSTAPVRLMALRYGPKMFHSEAIGSKGDRVEWRSLGQSLVCQFGHYLRLVDKEGGFEVRVWRELPI